MGSPIDPHSKLRMVMVAVNIENCLVVGNKERIKGMIHCLKIVILV
jgi:hypothetical protein